MSFMGQRRDPKSLASLTHPTPTTHQFRPTSRTLCRPFQHLFLIADIIHIFGGSYN